MLTTHPQTWTLKWSPTKNDQFSPGAPSGSILAILAILAIAIIYGQVIVSCKQNLYTLILQVVFFVTLAFSLARLVISAMRPTGSASESHGHSPPPPASPHRDERNPPNGRRKTGDSPWPFGFYVLSDDGRWNILVCIYIYIYIYVHIYICILIYCM